VTVITEPRQIRGLAILAQGSQIKRLSKTEYTVKSQSGHGWYLVKKIQHEWLCECQDNIQRRITCKHIYAVIYSLKLRERVISENPLATPEVQAEVCEKCSSEAIIKIGIRHNKSGNIQRFKCKSCGHKFIVNHGFERLKASPQVVTAALDLYFKGVSYRKIVDHLKQFYGTQVTHVAIIGWMKKFVTLVQPYVDTLKPNNLSGVLHVDEMMVKVKNTAPIESFGNYDWLWNLMDGETRFWISSLISKRRQTQDAQAVFQDAKAKMPTPPIAIAHDGLHSYGEAFKKEFRTQRQDILEVRSVSIGSRGLNNRIERLNQTFRDRNKVQRALHNDKSAQVMSDAVRINYNFLRPHMGLGGRTPSEAAGLNLGLQGNRWEAIIKKAAENKTKSVKQ